MGEWLTYSLLSLLIAGADFPKFSKTLSTFFSSTKLIFRALPKQSFVPILANFCAPEANFKEKRAKK